MKSGIILESFIIWDNDIFGFFLAFSNSKSFNFVYSLE